MKKKMLLFKRRGGTIPGRKIKAKMRLGKKRLQKEEKEVAEKVIRRGGFIQRKGLGFEGRQTSTGKGEQSQKNESIRTRRLPAQGTGGRFFAK